MSDLQNNNRKVIENQFDVYQQHLSLKEIARNCCFSDCNRISTLTP